MIPNFDLIVLNRKACRYNLKIIILLKSIGLASSEIILYFIHIFILFYIKILQLFYNSSRNTNTPFHPLLVLLVFPLELRMLSRCEVKFLKRVTQRK